MINVLASVGPMEALVVTGASITAAVAWRLLRTRE